MADRKTCGCPSSWESGPCKDPQCGVVKLLPRRWRPESTLVSQNALDLVDAALKASRQFGHQDAMSTLRAELNLYETETNYQHVHVCRQTLFEYIERLEKKAGVVRDRILRF